MKLKKTLNFFTYDFPYKGNDSKFIIDEFNFLAKKFENLNIIPLKNNSERIIIKDNNVFVDQDYTKQIFSVISLPHKIFNILICKYFWSEIFTLKLDRNFLKKIKTVIKERFMAESLCFFLKNKAKYNDKNIYYSFWANHTLLGFFLAKKKNLIKFCFSRILGSDLKGFIPNDDFVAFKVQKYASLNDVIILNDEQKNILTSENLIDEHKIHKNYLGIRSQLKQIVKLPNNNIISFASCGSLIHIKNTTEILKFLISFSKISINYKIVYYCIGSGPEKKEIRKFAEDNFPENLKFHYIEKLPKLIDFLNEKDVNFFLNFSLSEGVSFALMEALSCSIPIICSKIPGNMEVVNDENGYLVDNFSIKKYSDISIKILADIKNNNYSIKANNCQRIVNEKLSREICIDQYDSLLNKIINKN